jgi:hypothetical protein
MLPFAEFCDRRSTHQFHDEVGSTQPVHTGVKHLSDTRVLHASECLLLDLESGQDISSTLPVMEEFDGYMAVERMDLLRMVDSSHAAFSCNAEDSIPIDLGWGGR